MLLMLNKIHKFHFNELSLYMGFTLKYDPSKDITPIN
jgi:hypothetical protein